MTVSSGHEHCDDKGHDADVGSKRKFSANIDDKPSTEILVKRGMVEGTTVLNSDDATHVVPDTNHRSVSQQTSLVCGSAFEESSIHNIVSTVQCESMPSEHDIDLQDDCYARFKGKRRRQLYVLEICAGSAKLSKAAIDMGFMVLSIDHKTSRSCGVPIQVWDLEDPQQLQLLLDFIQEERDNILLVWIAPPCGTASRARERRQPKLEAQGVKVPVPLRSIEQPDQLDGLQGTDKIKTEKANVLYSSVHDIAVLCNDLSLFVAIENPYNSHFWGTTPMTLLNKAVANHSWVSFHNCCHGGDRDKLTSLWVNKPWLDNLEARCDGQHSHKSWTPSKTLGNVNYPTAEEASYPTILCARIISLISDQAEKMGVLVQDNLHQQMHDDLDTATNRIVLGCLPRGNKVKPLVAEFDHYVLALCNPQNGDAAEQTVLSLPKGAKIVSRRILNGENDRDRVFQEYDKDKIFIHYAKFPVEACTIGVPSGPEDFVRRAVAAGHPRSLDGFVDEVVKEAAMENFHRAPYELAKKRRWNQRALELAESEKQYKQSLPAHCSVALEGKRLLLFKEMLQEIGYPDDELIQHMSQGFSLSGWMPKSNVFLPGSRRPAFDKKTMMKLAKGLNRATLSSLEHRQDSELEQGAWDETLKEISNGWLWEDSNCDLSMHVVAKRFGIQQGPKIRVIDDCSCCGLNGSVGLREKFKLHSVDQLSSMISYSFGLCSGEHPTLLGRTYDLKSAYKQFPVGCADRDLLRIAVNEPGVDKPRIMGVNVLPFGAVGSVAAFLRVSVAVWILGVKCLGLYWSAFYDDFSIVTRAELQQNTAWACESLFTLLGMKFANSGAKYVPFSEKFKMLGLVMDLSQSKHKQIYLGHTDERAAELSSQIRNFLKSGLMSSKEAERLRGRMLFYESFSFGRLAGDAVKTIGRVATGSRKPMKFGYEVQRALEFLLHRVEHARPITVTQRLKHCWYIFTDGACEAEQSRGSIGGVLFSPQGECIRYFASEVPPHLMEHLLKASKNPIHELEVLPVLVSLMLWSDDVSCAPLVHYIDNESSRMALIKGWGETSNSAKLVKEYVNLEMETQVKTWFARVPSFSNVGDGPSRGDHSLVQKLGAVQTKVDWERIAEILIKMG